MEDKMNELTTAMMEHVCDKLCRFPMQCVGQKELEDVCIECQMGVFVCGILNLVNGDLEEETDGERY